MFSVLSIMLLSALVLCLVQGVSIYAYPCEVLCSLVTLYGAVHSAD